MLSCKSCGQSISANETHNCPGMFKNFIEEKHDEIKKPKHYTQGIECWDYIASHNMSFLEGNIIKYVTRYKDKNGIKDLHKARAYLDKLIESSNDQLCEHKNSKGTDDGSKFTRVCHDCGVIVAHYSLNCHHDFKSRHKKVECDKCEGWIL